MGSDSDESILFDTLAIAFVLPNMFFNKNRPV